MNAVAFALLILLSQANGQLSVKIEGELTGVALTVRSGNIQDTVRLIGAKATKKLIGNRLLIFVRRFGLLFLPQKWPVEVIVNPSFPVEFEFDLTNSELRIDANRMLIKLLDLGLKRGRLDADFGGVRMLKDSKVKIFANFSTVTLDHLEQLGIDALEISSELSKFRLSFRGPTERWFKVMFNGSFNSIQVVIPNDMSFVLKDRGLLNIVSRPPREGRISFKFVLGGILNRFKFKKI